MKKYKIMNVALLFSLFTLFSCSNSQNDNPEIEVNNNPLERTIEFNGLPSLKQGDILNLDDYVKVIPGLKETDEEREDLSFTYEILEDDVHISPVIEYTLDSGPSILKSNKLALVRSGYCVIEVQSGDAVSYLELNIEQESSLDEIENYFSNEFSHYEMYKAFEYVKNEGSVKKDEELYFIKDNNYFYYVDSCYGIYIGSDGLGYYYILNSIENQDSFKVCPTGQLATTISKSSYDNTFGTLSSLFKAENLEYVPGIDYLFGKDYSFAIPYYEKNETEFIQILSSFGLSYSHYVNSVRYYTTYVIPKLNDDVMEIYTISLTSTGSAILEGPYIIKEEKNYTLEKVEEYTEISCTLITEPIDLLNKFTSITNYTSEVSGYYRDIKGNKIDDPTYFASSLPSLEMTNKFSSTAIESNRFDYLDGGSDQNVLIKEETINGSTVVNKYIKDGDTYSLSGEYGNDPQSKTEVKKLSSSTTFKEYMPTSNFKESNFKYPVYLKEDSNTYKVAGFNDTYAKSLIKLILKATGCYSLQSSGTPLAYYIAYSSMSINLNLEDKTKINGEINTILVDSSYNYYEYHYEFSIYDINETTFNI